ncbi:MULTISPECIES: hypothetical protein [Nostoc]|uniref:Uncharacterized protein n=1 Tax=Nostoc paludosum FACHB-159 TaxID=2692908 RepID=A0ABR8KHU1_9NOSO|nr:MULTISPECIES: hypothetical protein [Nostoc]MBD2738434.1 hypothetical protein [Nostoc paludosum FACHB-159]
MGHGAWGQGERVIVKFSSLSPCLPHPRVPASPIKRLIQNPKSTAMR